MFFFRDLHFDNLLVCNDEFYLIDLASIRLGRRSLSIAKRAHNFARLLNKKRQREVIGDYGRQRLLDQYFQTADFTIPQQQRFMRYLQSRLKVPLD